MHQALKKALDNHNRQQARHCQQLHLRKSHARRHVLLQEQLIVRPNLQLKEYSCLPACRCLSHCALLGQVQGPGGALQLAVAKYKADIVQQHP